MTGWMRSPQFFDQPAALAEFGVRIRRNRSLGTITQPLPAPEHPGGRFPLGLLRRVDVAFWMAATESK